MSDTGLCCADNEIINSEHIALQHSDVQPFWAILNSRTITFSQYLQLPLSSSCVGKTEQEVTEMERESSRARMQKTSELGLLLLYQPMGCGIG